MKRVPYMDDQRLFEGTQAFDILSTKGIEKNRMMLKLMHHALKAAKNSPTRNKHKLDDPQHASYNDELRVNPELHASLDCMRWLLKDTTLNPVQPHTQVVAKDNTWWSPMQKAAAIEKEFPELGAYMLRKLTTHANTLAFMQNNPDLVRQAYETKKHNGAYKEPRNNQSAWDRYLSM